MNIQPILSEIEIKEETWRSGTIRFLLYCHDTFGLGHLRRTLSLAAHFTAALPNAEALIVTGSPVAHAFALPARTDYIKLPSVTKMSDGAYRARNLSMDFAAIRNLRATILREVTQAYHPDVFLVDHAPHGLKDEVLPTLTMLRVTQPDCLRVLGLRDIIDAAHFIRQTWTKEGIYHTLEYGYDRILVYGSQSLYDIGAEYDLSLPITKRVHYCGYLDRLTGMRASDASQAEAYSRPLPRSLTVHKQPFILLTAGGGGDGFPLMQAYLQGLQHLPSMPFTSVLLAGPLMPAEELCQLHELATMLPADWGHIETFLPDPLPLLRAADLVVAMAGYNTTCELLALRQRVLLIPRAAPRQEQLVRASLLARHGLAQMLYPDDVTPQRLMESIRCALAQPRLQAKQLAAAGIAFHGQHMALQVIVDDLLQRSHSRSQQLEVVQV
ncbi:MAG: glycosyltransferase [Ktedonobacteraceae bacterium]